MLFANAKEKIAMSSKMPELAWARFVYPNFYSDTFLSRMIVHVPASHLALNLLSATPIRAVP